MKIITDILQWKILLGSDFWTCDLSIPIIFNLEPYLLLTIRTFLAHAVGPISSGLGDCFVAVASKLSGTQSRLSQRLCAIHLFDLLATVTEPGFGYSPATPGVPKRSPIQVLSRPKFYLTSVFKWELVFPTWLGQLTKYHDLCFQSALTIVFLGSIWI